MASITMLGSGTGVPTARRASPGLLLRVEGWPDALIDPGPGALGRMAARGERIEEIGAVFLTHHHPDHTLDLMALLFARRSPELNWRHRNLMVLGPAGTTDLVRRMEDLYGSWVRAEEGSLSILEAKEGPFPPEAGRGGSAFVVDHGSGALGYRFETEKGTLALSGDSGPCEGLVNLGRGVDLFLLECSLPESAGEPTGHLTPSWAGRIASRAAPRMLVLYHLYPSVDPGEALRVLASHFTGPASVAEDGMCFRF